MISHATSFIVRRDDSCPFPKPDVCQQRPAFVTIGCVDYCPTCAPHWHPSLLPLDDDELAEAVERLEQEPRRDGVVKRTERVAVTPRQLGLLRWAVSGLQVDMERSGKTTARFDDITIDEVHEVAALLAHVECNPGHVLQVVEPAACWRLELPVETVPS